MCIAWSLLTLPLMLILPRRTGIVVGRFVIMCGFRWYAAWLSLIGAYRLDLRALDSLRAGPPVILAPNHPSLIDALLILARHPDLACVMKGELMRNPLFGPPARLAGYIRNGSARQMVREALGDLERGGALLLFPEGTRSTRSPTNPLTRSAAVIARHARVPVQTLLIETDSPFLGKGWPLWRAPRLPIHYRVHLGERFDPPDDPVAFTSELERYYATELRDAPQARWLGRRL